MTNFEKIWSQWDGLHDSGDQLKRQKSSSEKKLTPISVNPEQGTGIFKGSGKSDYSTTLSNCTCIDFSRREIPCKHMYRLAYELSLFNPGMDVHSSSMPGITRDDVIGIIQANLSEDEIRRFAYFCYGCGNNQETSELFAPELADRLIKNRLAEEVTDIPTLLWHLHMKEVRKFLLPLGIKSPRKKSELIALVAPHVSREEIVFPDNAKCLTLHSDIAHLGHTLHRRLCALYPDDTQTSWDDF